MTTYGVSFAMGDYVIGKGKTTLSRNTLAGFHAAHSFVDSGARTLLTP